jgi:protein-S-isoprenylcysteine O-methyltransferase Ste14
MLLIRAIVAFLALPGVVAYAVPLWLGVSAGRPVRHVGIGIAVVALGTSLLIWCVREFYISGRGTLAPWSPPRRLVTSGPYRFSRNPMYLGVATILIGWSVLWYSGTLAIYAAVVVIAFHLRVVLFEERWAARLSGEEWNAYRARVPRWLI